MEETLEERRYKILPIDRPGWGWIVVLGEGVQMVVVLNPVRQ